MERINFLKCKASIMDTGHLIGYKDSVDCLRGEKQQAREEVNSDLGDRISN